MSQGNYIALQPQKPVEYKAGDYAVQFSDWLIKRGDADKASQIKRMQEENDSLEKQTSKLDLKPFNTVLAYQGQINKMTDDAMEKIFFAKNNARNTKYSFAERQEFNNIAFRAQADVEKGATFFANPLFIKGSEELTRKLTNNELFKGDPTYGLALSIQNGYSELKTKGDGSLVITYKPDALNGINDAPIEELTVDQALQMYSSGGAKRLQPDTLKWLLTTNPAFSEETNPTGNTLTSTKTFNEPVARNAIILGMGFDPNKPLEEQFTSKGAMDPKAMQFFYETNGNKMPESGADIKKLIDDAVSYARTGVDPSTKVIQEKSAEEIRGLKLTNDGKELDNKEKRAFASRGYKSASGDNFEVEDGSASQGNFVTQVKDANNKIIGYKKEATSVMPIGKNMFMGFSQSIDKTRKDKSGNFVRYNSFKIGKPSSTGEIVFTPAILKPQWVEIVRSNKINPAVALSKLVKSAKEVNKWQPTIFKNDKSSEYQNMEIYNPSESKSDNQPTTVNVSDLISKYQPKK